jgi:hypothetical protein
MNVGTRVRWTDHLGVAREGVIVDVLASQYVVECEQGRIRYVFKAEHTLETV